MVHHGRECVVQYIMVGGVWYIKVGGVWYIMVGGCGTSW